MALSYDPDYWTVDDDGNPEFHGHGPAKEEPDCGLCNDRCRIPADWTRLVGLRWVSCPSCSPTRLVLLYQRFRLWKIRGWVWRAFHRGQFSDEAPF